MARTRVRQERPKSPTSKAGDQAGSYNSQHRGATVSANGCTTAKEILPGQETNASTRGGHEEPIVPPLPSTSPDWESLRDSLIPSQLWDAAHKLKSGCLPAEEYTQCYESDQQTIPVFLKKLLESGEDAALCHLQFLLTAHPMLMWHPYFATVMPRLYWFSGSQERFKAADDWLIKLLEAWAEGMTCGAAVSIKKVRTRKGRRPELFPHLDEREGWFSSEAADQDETRAREFLKMYKDLYRRLQFCSVVKNVGGWKEFIKGRAVDPEAADSELAREIQGVFQQFIKDVLRTLENKKLLVLFANPVYVAHKIEPIMDFFKPPENDLDTVQYQKMVSEVLGKPPGGHPRHKLTCELLATLSYRMPDGTHSVFSASSIEDKVEFLQRRYREPQLPDSPTSNSGTFIP